MLWIYYASTNVYQFQLEHPYAFQLSAFEIVFLFSYFERRIWWESNAATSGWQSQLVLSQNEVFVVQYLSGEMTGISILQLSPALFTKR